MRKLLISLIVLCCFYGNGVAGESIVCGSLWSGTLAASGVHTVTGVSQGSDGFFSIQPIFTGSGTLKIQYQVSNDGQTWSPVVDIINGATSGTVYPYPASGVNIFAGFQRIILTETTTTDTVIFSKVQRCAQ